MRRDQCDEQGHSSDDPSPARLRLNARHSARSYPILSAPHASSGAEIKPAVNSAPASAGLIAAAKLRGTAVKLAAPTGVDLGLDHPHRAADPRLQVPRYHFGKKASDDVRRASYGVFTTLVIGRDKSCAATGAPAATSKSAARRIHRSQLG